MYKAAVITVSDKGSIGKRIDTSGPAIKKILEEKGYEVEPVIIIPDEKEKIKEQLINCADNKKVQLVITTGGTGFSKRDITPEATLEVGEKRCDGISEAIRAYSMKFTPKAMLSRGVSVIRKETIIINLPGSEKAVKESLECIIDVLPHGIGILTGSESECGGK